MNHDLNLALWTSDLLGVSNTSMDADLSSVNGETELNDYMRVQDVSNDTDPQANVVETGPARVPTLVPDAMTRQYLRVSDNSVSPERLF